MERMLITGSRCLIRSEERARAADVLDLDRFLAVYFTGRSTPRSFDRYLLIYLSGGTGDLRIDARDYPMQYDTVYCIHPGQQLWMQQGEGLHGRVFLFSAELYPHTLENSSSILGSAIFNRYMPGVVHITGEVKSTVLGLLDDVLLEIAMEQQLQQAMLRVQVGLILVWLSRQQPSNGQTPASLRERELLRTFLDLVDKHFMHLRNVSDYAGLMTIRPERLTVKIKQLSGHPAGYHIRQRIVLEAKRQALCTGKRMKEVAFELGYRDMAHFSKLFKQGTGMNFSRYVQLYGA